MASGSVEAKFRVTVETGINAWCGAESWLRRNWDADDVFAFPMIQNATYETRWCWPYSNYNDRQTAIYNNRTTSQQIWYSVVHIKKA